MRRPVALASAVAAAAVSLLAAGCGGGSGSPQVANLGSTSTAATTTTKSTATVSGRGGRVSPNSGQGGMSASAITMNMGNAVDGAKFSACMRKRGVSNFPDPNAQGQIHVDSSMGINPQSPTFQSAQTACQQLLPNGGQPTPAQIAQRQQQMLAFSACMRADGIKDFPDPSNGGIKLHGGPGSDLDPNNPTFQKALQACQKNLPNTVQATAGDGKAGGG